MTLGTADGAGRPWVTPVYYSADDYIRFRESQADGGREWNVEDVEPPARLRLYRRTASEHFVLTPAGDPEFGSGVDRREPVTLAS